MEAEADILIDLARLRAATGAPDDAQRLAEEALLITERSGYALKGADAHLELAKLALNLSSVGPSCRSAQMSGTRSNASLPEQLDDAIKHASSAQREAALHHATEARRLAACDGPPDYTYKVAYDEAGVLLAQLGGG